MSFLSVPPQTPYDLNFEIFGVPVRVHPLFWLIAILFGGAGGNITYTLLVVVAFFVSILIHELGHSLMMRQYGQESYIVLYGMGGLAVPTSSGVLGGRRVGVGTSLVERIYISLAGPFAGFLFAGVICALVFALGGDISISWLLGVIPLPNASLPSAGWAANSLIAILMFINVFWGLINLMPVYPLDGGQVSRNLFLLGDPHDGVRKSLMLSVGAGVLMAIGGAVAFNSIWLALIFGLLAFQSWQQLSGSGRSMF